MVRNRRRSDARQSNHRQLSCSAIGVLALKQDAITLLTVLFVSWVSGARLYGQDTAIKGFVVDDRGDRVANADVSPAWRANGSPRRPDGENSNDVYAISGNKPGNIDLRVFPDPKFVVDGSGEMLDLGILALQGDLPDREDLELAARESGRWWDYTDHIGDPSPKWHAIDARGIPLNSNIEELQGKWVLLSSRGLSCVPCLSTHMPEVIEFYSDNANHRDRFEVVGICIDITGKMSNLRDVDSE